MSTGRAGSGLCPTWTRLECGGWIKNWPETDPEIWLDFSVWVSSVSGWFRSVSGLSPGTKSGRIRRYLAKIWPDPSISSRNTAGSVKIGQKSGRIRRDLAEIWPDPSISGRNMAGSVEIWPRFHQVMAGSRRIWSENRNTSLVRITIGLGRVLRVWKPKTDNRPVRGRVSFVGTRVRPLESSDRVAAGRTRAGWPG